MSTVAPHDPAAARGISRRAQSEIYRAGISGAKPGVPVDSDALEAAARKALSAEAFAYIAGGAGAERTVAANRAEFDRWQVWPRPLRDVATRDLSIELRVVALVDLGEAPLPDPGPDLEPAEVGGEISDRRCASRGLGSGERSGPHLGRTG